MHPMSRTRGGWPDMLRNVPREEEEAPTGRAD